MKSQKLRNLQKNRKLRKQKKGSLPRSQKLNSQPLLIHRTRPKKQLKILLIPTSKLKEMRRTKLQRKKRRLRRLLMR